MKPNSPFENHSRTLVPVRFEFTDPNARSVCVAGSFNQWSPASNPMHRHGREGWLWETALQSGAYEYCFVIDGVWTPDPASHDYIPNPFGGRNSILHVGASPAGAGTPLGNGSGSARPGDSLFGHEVTPARSSKSVGRPRRVKTTQSVEGISHVKLGARP